MGEHHPGTAEQVASLCYLLLVAADVVIVVDLLSGGNLHRWWSRQTRAVYRWATEPMQREAEIRREAAWVVWDAMQLLEEAQP